MTTTGSQTPQISLRDADQIPQLGFGVFQVPPADTSEVVARALATGYRHIDTAAAYRNEAGVGQAIRSSGLDRGEVFVTTKCFNDDHGYERAKHALSASLERLEMDYVDLYLIHWPVPVHDKYVETWKAFVELRAEGFVRSIGVSNFQPAHLERVIAETGETPAINQIELHPYFQQRGLRHEHEQLGIVTEAWSPLAQGKVLDDPAIVEIAKTHVEDTRAGRDPLASAARQRGDPEVGHSGADRRELRRLRLRAQQRRAGVDPGARPRPAYGARPRHVHTAIVQLKPRAPHSASSSVTTSPLKRISASLSSGVAPWVRIASRPPAARVSWGSPATG